MELEDYLLMFVVRQWVFLTKIAVNRRSAIYRKQGPSHKRGFLTG